MGQARDKSKRMEEGQTRAETITVMVASAGWASHSAWLRRLRHEPGIELTAEPIGDPTRLAECVEQQQPSVLLLDKAVLDRLDATSLRRIRQQCDRVRVLLVSNELCADLVAELLRHRFHGFLLSASPPDTCLKAIRAVRTGELWLSRASLAGVVAQLLRQTHTDSARGSAIASDGNPADALSPRELQVVTLLRRGYINKQIAHELGIREDTVKKHLQSVFAKLGVHRRALVAMAPVQARNEAPAPGPVGSTRNPEGIGQGGRADTR